MASVARTVQIDASEGWKSWQIALAVGAPICLGLAGLWFYKRNKSHKKQTPETSQNATVKTSPSQSESAARRAGEPPATQTTQETPLSKAQAIKVKGNKYFKGGKYREAIKCYTQALETCPPEHSQDISTFYANRAACYEKLKEPQLVVSDCTEALKRNPKYSKVLTRRAKACEQLGDIDHLSIALEDVSAVFLLEGVQNQDTLDVADRVLKEVGRIESIKEMQNRKPTMPSKHFIKSYLKTFVQDPVQQCFPAQQEQAEAGSQSVQEVQKTENIMEGEINGNENEDAGQKSGTENEDVDQKISNIPVKCPFRAAVEGMRDEKYDDVIGHCTTEIETTPPSDYQVLALLLRGTFYCLMGQTEKAFTDLNKVILTENVDTKVKVNALIKRGSLYVQNEKQTEGLDDFARALRMDPENSDIYHHRGHQNFQLERLDDALRDFETSMKKNPNFPISFIQRAFVEHQKAFLEQSTVKLEEAMGSYKEALKRFPDCADGHALYAQALSDMGKFEEADKELERAIELDPTNASTLVQRGRLKIQWKQELDEPYKLIEQAIDVDDKCEFAYEVLATIEVERGEITRAMDLFNRAIKLSRTQKDLASLFSLMYFVKAKLKAAQNLGLPVPSNINAMP